MSLILASASPIRRALLEQAGIEHQIAPANVDEGSIKSAHAGPEAATLALAKAKALGGAKGRPGDWVIGSDSMVSVDGRMFEKPAGRDQAAEHLRLFSGKTILLTSSVALARGAEVDWTFCDQASLEVRDLGEDFIQAYLEAEWPEVAYCVGVFRIEGRGITLFEQIEGDYFTILGIPLLPLLGALRKRGLAP